VTTLAQALAGLLLTAAAGAADQGVTPLLRTATPDQAVAFAVHYAAANPCSAGLTGLGLRIHWDSRRLAYTGLTGVLATGKVAQGAAEADTGNADGDATTDQRVLIAWADIDGAWPTAGRGPLTLDLNGSQTLDAADVPSEVFGVATDKPVSGRW